MATVINSSNTGSHTVEVANIPSRKDVYSITTERYNTLTRQMMYAQALFSRNELLAIRDSINNVLD